MATVAHSKTPGPTVGGHTPEPEFELKSRIAEANPGQPRPRIRHLVNPPVGASSIIPTYYCHANAFYDQIDPDTHDSPYDSTTPIFYAHGAAAVDVPGAAVPTLVAVAAVDARGGRGLPWPSLAFLGPGRGFTLPHLVYLLPGSTMQPRSECGDFDLRFYPVTAQE